MKKANDQVYRHEIKYRINGGTYHILRQRFAAVMQPDAHTRNGMYRVTSLYFDDIYRTAYNDKVNGALKRKKYRIRAYDLSPGLIHLEEKVKHGSVGYKKSTQITADEYRSILSGNYGFLADDKYADTSGGDMFASNSAVKLSPAVIVDYIREPFICAAGNVRVTFDMKISACINGYDMFDSSNIYDNVMPDNDIVLEVKYDNFIPAHILQMLTGINSMQESVSKYILCSDRLYQSL